MESCLLTIIAPPALEETLVDWLLEHDGIEGFSSAEISGHGGRQSGMTLLEQVTGRQRRLQFLVQTDLGTARAILREMRESYAGIGLHYFITPLLESGPI